MLSRSLLLLVLLGTARGADAPRFLLHGNMSHEPPTEDYLRFVEQVKPDVLIMGVFDQRLYAQPKYAELLERWQQVAARLHRSGIRLVGQMEMNVVTDRLLDQGESKGWFAFHDRSWDEARLGKRPARTAAELLEEPDLDRRGQVVPAIPEGDAVALCGCRVNTRALRSCINKPAWRETQKRMVRAAVTIGVDGFMTNRNYFGHCGCADCRAGFRKWLRERFTPAQLKERFAIADIDNHALNCVVGAHREIDTVPDALVLEKQRFAKHRVKDYLDDVYIRYGRTLKKDLFVSQWNHLAIFDELHLDRGHLPISTRTTFAHAGADERWGLSPELWGKGEDLIWYCNWGTTQNTILAKEYAGDTVLYGKYVRAMARGTPYVVNKYDFYRPRNMMAEAAALGYATNAIATPWQTEEDRTTVLRYFQFLKKHDALYRSAETLAEVGLLCPRRAVHAGDASGLEYVEAAGRSLIRDHFLFDLLPDDLPLETSLKGYRAVAATGLEYLNKDERAVLQRFVEQGGKLLVLPVRSADRRRAGAATSGVQRLEAPVLPGATVVDDVRTNPTGFRAALRRVVGQDQLSHFDAPWTVEVHAYRQARRVVLHLVTYNHDEKAAGKSVVAREAPRAADPVAVRLRLPAQFKIGKVRFLSPDADDEQSLPFRQEGGWLTLTVPGFLVYGVCVLQE